MSTLTLRGDWRDCGNGEVRTERTSASHARWIAALLERDGVVARIERPDYWERRDDRVVIAARADMERIWEAQRAAFEAQRARDIEAARHRPAPASFPDEWSF